MPMLIKLFDTNIVAKSSCGLLSSLVAAAEALSFLSLKSRISFGLNEKKATSEPEIKAEQTSKIKVVAKANADENDSEK